MSESEQQMMKANKDHLEIMVAKSFWTDAQDLKPLRDAIAS